MENEDGSSFKARVDKIFGSLPTSSSSSFSQSAWSLTDDEIEKKEWRRHSKDDDDDTIVTAPCSGSSGFSGVFDRERKAKRNDFEDDLEDDDEDNDDGGGSGDDDGARDEWEIRGSIGLDPTLDNEPEEDEYDKVAEGRENEGDRIYMSAVTDHGPYLNSHNVLPDSVYDAVKDARANHFAAKARLEEDKAESLKYSNPLSRKAADGNKTKPKPALKMDSSSSSKGQRRVRFDPYCKNKSEEKPDVSNDMPVVQTTAADYQAWVKTSPAVPDYLLNPSKYTRYSFDSTSEIDEMEVIKPDKASKLEEVPLHHPKFTPRKKENSPTPMDSSSNEVAELKHSGAAPRIAAVEDLTSDDMDVEDEDVKKAEAKKTENQKPSRHYRPRPKLDDPID